jgi:uncharacterized protein (TIGR03083 family)
VKPNETWTHIHAERAAMAETWSAFSGEQWAAPSWCGGWRIQETAGHILAAAEQTPPNFYKELIGAGFRFNVFTDRAAKRLGALSPDELVQRLLLRTSTRNRPPAPVVAMLGEIVVHGEDIRRPLGLDHSYSEAALVAVAVNYTKTNLLIGSKRRVDGLCVRATDSEWTHGDGPEVSGSLVNLILAMAGRTGALGSLTGDGVAVLAARG